MHNDLTPAPRRAEGWLLVVGLLILLGLLGHLLNQQRLSKRPPDNVKSPQLPDRVQTTPKTDVPDVTPRKDDGNSAVSQKSSSAPMQVVYVVTISIASATVTEG